MPPSDACWPSSLPHVLLVGGGVVGQAVGEAHGRREISFCLADQDTAALESLRSQWTQLGWQVIDQDLGLDGLSAISVHFESSKSRPASPLVIESIYEDAGAKRKLFATLQERFGAAPVLCTNTSNLTIAQIVDGELLDPSRVVGLHFFMPVRERGAAEVISGALTDESATHAATEHAKLLGKHPLHVGDGPGFVVNRMLSPYLNQALLLLCRGVTEDQIQRAALAYGMPMSPLELIDWIGTGTMYHAGRAFIFAFPRRLEPSVLIPALVKRKRFGRSVGKGLYDYQAGCRSQSLAEETQALIKDYSVKPLELDDLSVLGLLTIPMWNEAWRLLSEEIAPSMDVIDSAMVGGLGFHSDTRWSEFFAELGEKRIEEMSQRWGGEFSVMKP